jgi:hypothetical protein
MCGLLRPADHVSQETRDRLFKNEQFSAQCIGFGRKPVREIRRPLKRRYFGGCSSLLIQREALSDLSGSPGSHFSQWNARRPLPPGGSLRIRSAPHLGQVGRSVCPTASICRRIRWPVHSKFQLAGRIIPLTCMPPMEGNPNPPLPHKATSPGSIRDSAFSLSLRKMPADPGTMAGRACAVRAGQSVTVRTQCGARMPPRSDCLAESAPPCDRSCWRPACWLRDDR